MADIALVNANFRPLEGIENRHIVMFADEAITRGQPVYRKTNGRAGVARANAVGTSKLVGIATTTVPAGTAFEAMYHGRLVGWTLTSINPGTTVFLSITATGLIADAAAAGVGNVIVPIGSVHTMTNVAETKYVFVDIPQNAPTPVAI